MNVNGTRIKDEVIEDLRAFMDARPAGFTSDQVEAELITILRRHGQPPSLSVSMTLRFLEEERGRGWVAVIKTRDRGVPKPIGKNVWQVTMAGLHRGAMDT